MRKFIPNTFIASLFALLLATLPMGGVKAAGNVMWAGLDTETGTLTFKYSSLDEISKETSTYFVYYVPTSKLSAINYPDWHIKHTNINKVVFDRNFKDARPTTCEKWFYECNQLTIIEGLENLNTSMTTDMSYMFYKCQNLRNIDLSHFNTSNVTKMRGMFSQCRSLETLDLSLFNTSNVKDMSTMFSSCVSIQTLDLSNFDTSNVTAIRSMFTGCQELTSINISTWNTKKVTDMAGLFTNCHKLSTINLSNFNTENVRYFVSMFSGCRSLYSLNLSNFNTSNAIGQMSNMFYNCASLTSLDLSNFDTRNVTQMDNMFYLCDKLTTLNISNFDTKNVTNMSGMFAFCGVPNLDITCLNVQNVTNMEKMFYGANIASLDLSEFDTRNVTNYSNMLQECDKLTTLTLPSNYASILAESKWTSEYNTANILTTIYIPVDQYEACKNDPNAEGRTVLPYIKVAPQNEYGTICVPMGSKLESGTFSGFDKLYSPTLNAGKVTLNEVSQITPGAAYVYQQGGKSQSIKKYAAESNSTVPVKNAITFTPDGSTLENTPNTGNIMQGTYEEGTVPMGCYVMQPDGTFTKVTDGNTTIGAYCAYLTEVSQEETIKPTYITTGIKEISLGSNKQATIYDLTGRRISHPQKGSLYILNGKKVIF